MLKEIMLEGMEYEELVELLWLIIQGCEITEEDKLKAYLLWDLLEAQR